MSNVCRAGQFTRIAKGGWSSSGCMILRTLGERSSGIDEGKRECVECARKRRARRQWFQVSIPSQNELHMTQSKKRLGLG